jgi:hypothetical protein
MAQLGVGAPDKGCGIPSFGSLRGHPVPRLPASLALIWATFVALSV